jgi:hypothetical protein
MRVLMNGRRASETGRACCLAPSPAGVRADCISLITQGSGKPIRPASRVPTRGRLPPALGRPIAAMGGARKTKG